MNPSSSGGGLVNSDSKYAPIAIFAYNRADKLQALTNSLLACEGFQQSAVTIFVDGPKDNADASSVRAVRDFVTSVNRPNVSFTFGDVNRGLRRSIFAGVSQILQQNRAVIVLEDDLVLSPIALNYFNLALRRYEANERVWSIAGYIYDSQILSRGESSLSLPFAHPWGWATWSRAWNKFNLDNHPPTRQLQSHAFRSAFDMGGLYPFSRLLENSIKGAINSWFVHWYYTLFEHAGVSIFPPRRVVENFGLTQGSHGGPLNPHGMLVKRPELLSSVPQLQQLTGIDYWALDALKDSRELQVQRWIARAGLAKRSLSRRFSL